VLYWAFVNQTEIHLTVSSVILNAKFQKCVLSSSEDQYTGTTASCVHFVHLYELLFKIHNFRFRNQFNMLMHLIFIIP
jgi:hypothetical protein